MAVTAEVIAIEFVAPANADISLCHPSSFCLSERGFWYFWQLLRQLVFVFSIFGNCCVDCFFLFSNCWQLLHLSFPFLANNMRFFKKTQTIRANSLAAFLAVFLAAFLAVILGFTHNAGVSEFLATGTLMPSLASGASGRFVAGSRHRCFPTRSRPHCGGILWCFHWFLIHVGGIDRALKSGV